MFLTSDKIKEAISNSELGIAPFDSNLLKDASYTFTLGKIVRTLKNEGALDSREDPLFHEAQISGDGYELKPGSFGIFLTEQKVTLNGKFVCLVSTRATIASMGLDVTQSSFFAEPDTDNQFALEITNRGPLSVKLYPGTKIAKGAFSRVS